VDMAGNELFAGASLAHDERVSPARRVKRMRSSKAREQGSSKTRTLARVGAAMRRSWCRLRRGFPILLADSSDKDEEEGGAGYWTIMTTHNNTTNSVVYSSTLFSF
jgi:hypothetical protein